MSASDDSGRDNLQGLMALVGITAGVIPLLRVAFGGEVGFVLAWLPGTDGSPGRWAVPLAILLVAGVVIMVVERGKEGS